MYTIYLHTCVSNGKHYVGITKQEPYFKRFNGNGSGYKTCARFWNAIQKYGWENFEHCALSTTETFEQAAELEKYYIKFYRTEDDRYGYNIHQGGSGGNMPDSTKEAIRRASIGKPGTMTGRHHTEEAKKHISESQRGNVFTEEHLANLRAAHAKRRGKPGCKMSDENKQKLIERSVVKVQCVETGTVYESMSECAKQHNVLVSNLSRAIKEGRKYKGFHFVKLYA